MEESIEITTALYTHCIRKAAATQEQKPYK